MNPLYIILRVSYPVSLALLITLGIRSLTVQASEPLTFGELPQVSISLPEELHGSADIPSVDLDGSWKWDGAPDYKNERLAYYQERLKEKGITDPKKLRLLTAQLIQEAGSLSEDTIGDHGCSFGILQYNACAHHGMKAKAFLAQPQWRQWNDWRYQLDRMADMVAERVALYDGNMVRVIVHHNHPAAAKSGKRTGYYDQVSSKAASLLSL